MQKILNRLLETRIRILKFPNIHRNWVLKKTWYREEDRREDKGNKSQDLKDTMRTNKTKEKC